MAWVCSCHTQLSDAPELPDDVLHLTPVTPAISVGGPLFSDSSDCASFNACSCRLSKGSQNSTDASRAAAMASNQSSAQQNGSYGSAAQQTHVKSARQAQGQLTRADVEEAYRLFQVRECALRET